MSQLTKEAAVKRDVAVDMMQWVETNGKQLGQALEELFTPYLEEGETMPDMGLVLQLMHRRTKDQIVKVEVADQKHSQEKDEDGESRETRDKADATAREELMHLRSSVESAHGKESLTRTGIPSRLPNTPKQLRDILANSLSRLAEGVSLPPPRKPNFPFWTEEALKEQILEIFFSLETALKNLSRELRESEVALTEKWKEINALHATNQSNVLVLEGLARMAGLEELANRIRTTIPSRPSTSASPDASNPEASNPDTSSTEASDATSTEPTPSTT